MAASSLDKAYYLVKTGKEVAKFLYDRYQKMKERKPVCIMHQNSKTGKWEFQVVDAVYTKDMATENAKMLNERADGKLTDQAVDEMLVKRLEIHRKNIAAFNKNFKFKEWTPAIDMQILANKIVPMTALTKDKLTSTEGYSTDYSKSYICSIEVMKAFEKLQKQGINPMDVFEEKLLYKDGDGFESKKGFKDGKKENSQFIKSKCKANEVKAIRNFIMLQQMQKNTPDLDLGTTDLDLGTESFTYDEIGPDDVISRGNIQYAQDTVLNDLDLEWVNSYDVINNELDLTLDQEPEKKSSQGHVKQ